MSIISKRCSEYYNESVVKFLLNTEGNNNLFNEIEVENEIDGILEIYIEEDLTPIEIDIIASLMREVHYERDMLKLKAMALRFTPKDLNVFSPANERKSFMELVENIRLENAKMLDLYNSVDRLTGVRKTLDMVL